MNVEGDGQDLAVLLFPEGLIPDILSLVVDVWKTLNGIAPTDGETKITRRLTKAMQVEKRKRGLKFSVRSHAEELEDLDDDTGKGFSEIDILLQHGNDERCYFAFEAKKLNSTSKNGKPDSGSSKYVGGPGMGAFIDGTYAREQPHGGMLGYVMDGDCANAKARVADSMANRLLELKMSSPCQLHPSRHFPQSLDLFETRHKLDRGEFVIYHVLLAAA